MKQKPNNRDNDIEQVAQDKSCDNTTSHSAEETSMINNYMLAYAYPFIAIDFTIVVDEVRKMVKYWFPEKGQRVAIYKNKTHENI